MLRAVLAMNMPPARATQIAAGAGQFIAIAAGLLALWSGNYWYLLIALFVYIGAGQEAGAYRQAALIEGVRVREAMISDIRTLGVGNTLKEAADVLLDTSQHDFPVLHGDAVQGVLTRNDLLRALAAQGPGGYVAGCHEPAVRRRRPGRRPGRDPAAPASYAWPPARHGRGTPARHRHRREHSRVLRHPPDYGGP